MHALTEQVSVSPQLWPSEIKTLKEAGFEQIICNRPDGESPDQPSFEEIQAVAESIGMQTLYAPFFGGSFPDDAIGIVEDALATGKKTAMYCLSGTRSAIIWAAIEVKSGKEVDEVIDSVAQAGYGIGQLRSFLLTQQR